MSEGETTAAMPGQPPPSGDAAALAFEALREEVALVRRAMAGLAAEKAAIEIPDYSATLGEIAHQLADTKLGMHKLASRPALTLTPSEVARQITSGAEQVRQADHAALHEVRSGLQALSRDLAQRLSSAREADRQRLWLIASGSSGLCLGMLLWALGVGAIARAAPSAWLWPERMAARTLRMDMWEAGARMMARAKPQARARLQEVDQLASGNEDRTAACQANAGKAHKAVRCTIEVQAPDAEGK